jgi:hypothetical protein
VHRLTGGPRHSRSFNSSRCSRRHSRVRLTEHGRHHEPSPVSARGFAGNAAAANVWRQRASVFQARVTPASCKSFRRVSGVRLFDGVGRRLPPPEEGPRPGTTLEAQPLSSLHLSATVVDDCGSSSKEALSLVLLYAAYEPAKVERAAFRRLNLLLRLYAPG